MKPYVDAYKIERDLVDTDAWIMGMYVKRAIDVTAEQIIAGMSKKKATLSYPDKPIHLLNEEKTEQLELSEDEKIRQTKMLFTSLKIMQSNFERSHPKNK